MIGPIYGNFRGEIKKKGDFTLEKLGEPNTDF